MFTDSLGTLMAIIGGLLIVYVSWDLLTRLSPDARGIRFKPIPYWRPVLGLALIAGGIVLIITL